MKFVFRVDGSLEIGGGHIVRCCNLALALKKQNKHILFLTQNLSGGFVQYIERQGFEVVNYSLSLNVQDPKWWMEDFEVIKDHLGSTDVVVVDHYFLDSSWEKRVKSLVHSIVVIDDLANRKHQCDFLIDYTYTQDENRYNNLVQLETKLLLGPQYCILNSDFKPFNRTELNSEIKIKKLLLFFGSNDFYNLNLKCLQAIEHLFPGVYDYDVVVGEKSEFNDELLSFQKKIGDRLKVHVQTREMSKLMRDADLYIGSGGTVTWERCILSLPSIVVAVAENQIYASTNLHEFGAITFVGRGNDQDVASKVCLELEKFRLNLELYKKMSLKAFEIMSVNGVLKIIEEIS